MLTESWTGWGSSGGTSWRLSTTYRTSWSAELYRFGSKPLLGIEISDTNTICVTGAPDEAARIASSTRFPGIVFERV